MAEFLTTTGGANSIEDIISTAKTQLYLYSPYLKLSKTLLERLKDTARRSVKIVIVYGKQELNAEEKQKLVSLSNLELYYFENLHAKCYFNHRKMVITSMNVYEFSERNNREMGVLLDSERDIEAFTKAYTEAVSILKNAKKINISELKTTKGAGHCIRCLTEIKLDVTKPLCLNCYRQWARFNNRLYPEKYCHSCGVEHKTCLESPNCSICSS